MAALPAGAKATSNVVGPQRNPTAIVVGPMPKRLERRMAENAAMNEPTLPIEKASPITPAESSSSRTR